MNIVKIFALAIMSMACTLSLQARSITVPATDSRITHTGRVVSSDGALAFDWAGAKFNLRFKGTRLEVKCSDTHHNYFNVWVDNAYCEKEDFVLTTHGTDTTLVIVQNLKAGIHDVVLQKRTEGEQGKVTFSSFTCDGDFLQAEGLHERLIEFVGDSYTCGYGSENSGRDDPFTPETENCNLTYAAIAARYFGADYTLVSHSGQGIARNWGESSPGYYMPDRYEQEFDMFKEPLRLSEPRKADIVVIYLGTNDFSVNRQPSFGVFKDNYLRLISEIRARHGEQVPILCMAPTHVDEHLVEYIQDIAERSGLNDVWFTRMVNSTHNLDSDLGASWHPNYNGHRKIAASVISSISTITGWDLEDKVIK